MLQKANAMTKSTDYVAHTYQKPKKTIDMQININLKRENTDELNLLSSEQKKLNKEKLIS